jgi:uncharacterized membrane protein (DUF106 family)
MTPRTQLLERLRGWPRGYKFAVLLVAAWAPLLFPERPLWTVVIMAVTTMLFFVVTGRVTPEDEQEARIRHESGDAES